MTLVPPAAALERPRRLKPERDPGHVLRGNVSVPDVPDGGAA